MPRLSPSLLLRAGKESQHLRNLLVECRDLDSARNELRWLKEHASDVGRQRESRPRERLLSKLVQRRFRSEPLQYIIGNQPFGDVEILCRKGVLIPRPETETYTEKLASLLQQLQQSGNLNQPRLQILDLCTGTGCIPLLLHTLLTPVRCSSTQLRQEVQISGIDISPTALGLAARNLSHNIQLGNLHPSARQDITFHYADILNLPPSSPFLNTTYDVLISNPPYISPTDYSPSGRTTRSVRNHEPKLALVPPPPPPPPLSNPRANTSIHAADTFYHALLSIAHQTSPKLICFEVGDTEQARRIAALTLAQSPTTIAPNLSHNQTNGTQDSPIIEIWSDDGSIYPYIPKDNQSSDRPKPSLSTYYDTASGSERAVVVWKGSWARWRKEQVESQYNIRS